MLESHLSLSKFFRFVEWNPFSAASGVRLWASFQGVGVQRRKWFPTTNDPQTGTDPQVGPQMIPPENEEWHGVCSSGREFNF